MEGAGEETGWNKALAAVTVAVTVQQQHRAVKGDRQDTSQSSIHVATIPHLNVLTGASLVHCLLLWLFFYYSVCKLRSEWYKLACCDEQAKSPPFKEDMLSTTCSRLAWQTLNQFSTCKVPSFRHHRL